MSILLKSASAVIVTVSSASLCLFATVFTLNQPTATK